MEEIKENYPSKFQKDIVVDGGRKQEAIVNTTPGKQVVNLPEVKDVKGLAGVEHGAGPIPTPYELTAQKLHEVLNGSESIVADVSEDGKKIIVKIDEEVLDFILPKEVPTSKIIHEADATHTTITIESGVFDVTHCYDIKIEIEGNGVHYGIVTSVFPYDGSEAIVTTHLTVNGTTEEVFASMSSNGVVNIIVPFVMTPESETTTIFYKRAF